MKRIHLILLQLLICNFIFAQDNKIENIIIVTTDGFRWQEVFKGVDSAIAEMPKFNQDHKKDIYQNYAASTSEESRKKLLPFIWGTMAKNGQIYGNRKFNNNVDNSNPYWFSYPGYSEIFCGYVDTAVNSNDYKPNPNTNVLEYLNKQSAYKQKVAAFGAWDAFDRILNEKRSNFPVFSGYDDCCGNSKDSIADLINEMKKNSYNPLGSEEVLDVFTNYEAFHYLKTVQPKVLYISYGETDEWAHKGNYMDYLDAAHRVDKWLEDLWNYIQSSPVYKNKTALFVTVDHGRGDLDKTKWTSHNSKIEDSHQIWFAVMGPGILPKGEIKTGMQLYQKQFAQTFAELLNCNFTCEHPVANGLKKLITEK
ncbi:MAG: alkaline phosphatase family protein [Bacteroidia bacterium]